MRLRLTTGWVAAGIVAAAVARMHAQEPKPVPAPVDVKAPPASAGKTKSGLASRVLTPGNGTSHPASDDLVTVHYSGWTTDGKMLDSSGDQPATFPLDRVIAGLTEGVQLMVAGEKRRLWIPEAIAYKGREGRHKGMLVFDVELLSFTTPPSKAPPDVKEAPADAKRTASGMSYKVIRAGTGARHPRATDRVTVHYTGWTTDGKMFDSSVQRGEPTTFGLNGVIAGWTEGVQLMVEGEKTRFWIPENLAYKGQQAPFGALVFDVELLKIN
jgi:FKBP-type peptidyl-prolyl cis-trans isomerase